MALDTRTPQVPPRKTTSSQSVELCYNITDTCSGANIYIKCALQINIVYVDLFVLFQLFPDFVLSVEIVIMRFCFLLNVE